MRKRILTVAPMRRALGYLLLILAVAHGVPAAEANPLEFHIRFDAKVSNTPFTGRVYVMLSREPAAEPRSAPNWFRPDPFFARDMKDWKPGDITVLASDALGFPIP